jgi:alcohol dehydrogenase class IV
MCALCSAPTRPFVGPSRMVAGPGSSAACSNELRALGISPDHGPVVVVADAAVQDLGLHLSVCRSLEAAGYTVLVGPGVSAEPGPETVRALLPHQEGTVAAIVIVGGGSALDAGKLVSVALANDVDLTAGLSPDADITPGPPVLAVPTTAGTGAEVTAVAMLWHDGRKRMFVHPHLVPRAVLIDPELMVGLPASVTAAGGFDALGHAIESLLSTFRTPVTEAAAREALRLLSTSLPAAYENGDLESRYGTALGAYHAGLALNASVVLGHSLAYAISARTGLPHGVSVAMALPYCLAHARPAREPEIAEMAAIVCGEPDPELLLRWIVEHSSRMGIPTSLSELGVTSDEVAAIAADCVDNYPRPNHPVPIDHAGVLALVERLHAGEPYAAWLDAALPDPAPHDNDSEALA